MVVAAFLPADSAQRVTRLLPRCEVRFAASWRELDCLLRDGVQIALFDPAAGEPTQAAHASAFWVKHKNVTPVAYVIPSAANLKAIFRLSRLGLQHVLVYKDSRTEAQMLATVESLAGQELAVGLLATVEPKLRSLPRPLRGAITHLFQHPKRYETGQDLARQAGITNRRLYREFRKAGLRPPKQLVLFAKAVHACGYVCSGKLPPRLAQRKLGYNSSQLFARHIHSIVGCAPTHLSGVVDYEELTLRLVEWMFKPYRARIALALRSSA